MNRTFLIGLLTVAGIVFSGCSNNNRADKPEPDAPGAPRLVVSGHVTNTANEPLLGIAVSVFGVREAQETDILSYNYALTDSAGQYTIIRYRGRELPVEVTVVATDSAGLYAEQTRICQVSYDSIQTGYTPNTKSPYNGFVTADFILAK